MLLAQMIIGSPDWIWVAVGGIVLVAWLVLWSYSHPTAAGARLAAAAKLLGIAAIGFLLAEPLWSSSRAKPGANLFVLLADNSRSMSVVNPALGKSRLDLVRERLTDEKADWTARLAETFQLRRYIFDSRLKSTESFDVLDGTGSSTSLVDSLCGLAERFRGRPLAGVLTFTDGVSADTPDSLKEASNLPPLYFLQLPRESGLRDVRLDRVAVSQTVFEDAPVELQCDVLATGYADGTTLKAAVLNSRGITVEEKTERMSGEDGKAVFRFQFRPTEPELAFYRVRVAAESEWGQFANPDALREATLENNERLIAVDQGGGPFRLLYVAGQPNFDFKFIRRALLVDPQVQLTGILRIAKKEPKFDFRGRAGDDKNSLYRGFDVEDPEDAERYDQPVLARVGTVDENELRDGFPKSPEDLFKFHAVILDNLEAAFFTPDQMSLLEDFVTRRGGGLIMLGGHESFQEGGYERTPLGEMLPVYVDRDRESFAGGPFRMDLTRDGIREPWVRLRLNEVDEQNRVSGMPGFLAMNRVSGIKPGATVMAELIDNADQRWPALVVQRFGAGRTAAFTVADGWRWHLHGDAEEGEGDDFGKMWRQTARWLVSDVPNRVALEIERSTDRPDAPVKLIARIRDEKFEPLDDARLNLEIQLPTGKPLELSMEPSPGKAGVFEASLTPLEPGAYAATVEATDESGDKVGAASVGWASEPAFEEFQTLSPNVDLLRRIADMTGGDVVPWDDLESFVASLPNREVPIHERRLTPLWHHPLIFGFVLACLVLEWGLRRRRGLP